MPIAIIGGGVTGISTAYHLATMGLAKSTILLEAEVVGFGATGRSGGVLVASNEALPGSEQDLEYLHMSLNRIGCPDAIRTAVGCLTGLSGEFDHDTVDPLRLVELFAAEAIRKGCLICENSPVTSVSEHANRVRLNLPSGSLDCSSCLFATGAYTRDRATREALGIGVYTESCIAFRAPGITLPWTYYAPVDTQGDFVWGRRLELDSFLLGGGNAYSTPEGMSAAEALARMMRAVSSVFQVSSVQTIACWSGRLSRFKDGSSWQVMRIPGYRRLMFAGGYDGYGLLAGFRAGRLAAESLAKQVAS